MAEIKISHWEVTPEMIDDTSEEEMAFTAIHNGGALGLIYQHTCEIMPHMKYKYFWKVIVNEPTDYIVRGYANTFEDCAEAVAEALQSAEDGESDEDAPDYDPDEDRPAEFSSPEEEDGDWAP